MFPPTPRSESASTDSAAGPNTDSLETFLFYLGRPDGPSAEVLLRRAAAHLARVMPDAGVPLETSLTLLDGLNGGWCRVEPSGTVGLPVLDEHVDDEQAVLVFGDLTGVPEDETARRIAREGVEDASELDGSFGAVVVHRPTGQVNLLTDCLGSRALRYFAGEDFLLAAPHDLTLLASGLVEVSLDLVSVASSVTTGWSLRGRSLLRGVATSRPDERVHWQHGALRREETFLIDPGRRIAVGDKRRIRQQVEAMAEVAREGARAFASRWPQAGIQLTAGMDSRAAMAAILPSLDRERTFVQTTGYPNSPDVRTARRIAEHYGLTFKRTEPQAPSSGGFLKTVDLFAFSMNGDTNAKRAPQVDGTYAERDSALSWGGAAAIFRGHYYSRTANRPLGLQDALDKFRTARSGRHLAFDPRVEEGLARRVEETVRHYAGASTDGYDILDLLYAQERACVWDALKDRFTWTSTAFWTPFRDRRLVRMAYRLPAPISEYARIHETLIRQTLPWAYWVRCNYETLMPLEMAGAARPLLKRLDRRARRVAARLKARSAPTAEHAGHEQAQAAMFAGPLADPIRDLLTQTSSISLELFGREELERLLREHTEGTHDHVQVLGRLVTAERWLHLARAFADVPS